MLSMKKKLSGNNGIMLICRQCSLCCPYLFSAQHDVLFDKLTVEEHLIFFAKLKGCTGTTVQSEVNQMLRALRFEQFRYRQAHTLSGGMKRKLSVGIALIGGSKASGIFFQREIS